MHRRTFLQGSAAALVSLAGSVVTGCRGHQYGQVMTDNQQNMVGSHAAGAETFRPLVEQSVSRLLGRCGPEIQQVSGVNHAVARRICFVGLENRSSEEIGDFRDQLVDTIENSVSQSPSSFQLISGRFVQAGLQQLRLRPDELFVPQNQRAFLGIMEQQGQPFDYLLFARLTSGTTRTNNNSQRDYQLTLELVNIQTGDQERESAMIRKSYHHSRVGRFLSSH